MERKEKLTRDDLYRMEIGETKTFHLTSARALDSAATTAVQVSHLEGCRFSCSRDYAENVITITKSMV